jgi:hypothetical protein
MSLLKGLASPATEIMDGIPREEQVRVAAGCYDTRFPRLREAYVAALVEEMANAILANVLRFQQCPDVHWPRADGSWHLVEDSDTIH